MKRKDIVVGMQVDVIQCGSTDYSNVTVVSEPYQADPDRSGRFLWKCDVEVVCRKTGMVRRKPCNIGTLQPIVT